MTFLCNQHLVLGKMLEIWTYLKPSEPTASNIDCRDLQKFESIHFEEYSIDSQILVHRYHCDTRPLCKQYTSVGSHRV